MKSDQKGLLNNYHALTGTTENETAETHGRASLLLHKTYLAEDLCFLVIDIFLISVVVIICHSNALEHVHCSI